MGSDDDYIYVDHSGDETEHIYDEETDNDDNFEVDQINQTKHKSGRGSFVKSIISEVVAGESRLESEEIETLRGEIIDDEDMKMFKPAPSDDDVVEAEVIIDGKVNDIPLERPTPKDDFFEEDEELNIFNDNLPDLDNDDYDDDIHREATRVIDEAMSEFMDEVFDKTPESSVNEEDIQDHYVDEEIETLGINEEFEERDIQDRYVDEEIETPDFKQEDNAESEELSDELTEENPVESGDEAYYKGANDVTNPLRKNNVYYKEHKSRSIKDSIKGFKKDMQYINKSLNEIENPTQIDYVSVVDRTEEYDPNDYLSRPSDDDSDKIIQMEEELSFAEKEEKRIKQEMMMEELEKEIASDDNVIVTVNEQHRREDLKDQALEDIIQSANDDYKEIEKKRHQKDNTLKAFDDKKLPGKRKLEDEIIDYVQATDIGLTSQDELYSKPISDVSKSIKNIVDIEGPIHIKEVTNRVKDSFNIKRAGSNLKKTVNLAIENAENSGDIIRIGDFLYDASNNNVIIRKRNKPNIELISDEEIAKSIELVLLHKSNITTGQIAKETSRNFGFKSTSKKTATRINGVLDLMIANNRVKIVDDYVELN